MPRGEGALFEGGQVLAHPAGDFGGLLEKGERPVTLEGQLRSFLAVPDSVIAVARNVELLHRLDAAFFRVGEARGGVLVKYHAGEPQASEDDLRAELERHVWR